MMGESLTQHISRFVPRFFLLFEYSADDEGVAAVLVGLVCSSYVLSLSLTWLGELIFIYFIAGGRGESA